MSVNAQPEKMAFGAEVKQLLSLVANALYSNKEVFLRELVSNASDAADKLRYKALSDSALYESDGDLKIWIDVDKENRVITIRDNGIGMTREEVCENLGTIAKSGTKAFRDLLSGDQEKDSQLIGQFGVGFYSAFVVADEVTVRTRAAGMTVDQGVEWRSKGDGEYTVENIERSERGTEIRMHLKEDAAEFSDPMRLRTIIRKYSDHILLPIEMHKDEVKSEEDDKDEIVVPEYEQVNEANALWTLSKSEIKDEDYQALYKHISHDFEDPLAWAHNKVEGKLEYTSLLYIPKRAPFNLFDRDAQRGLKLYVKRVFIMDDAEHFLPTYLRFVKGVVDSNDLPLNVSRELLQSNRVIDKIKAACVKRILSVLEGMANNDAEKYAEFWKTFGSVIKEGPAEDMGNKDRVAKLLRFSSTHETKEEQTVTLDDYISRMSEKQEKIYYLVADTFAGAQSSPLLEVFRKKGVEVLLMSDRIDEWLMAHLNEYEGKSFQSIAKGELDIDKLGSEESEEDKKEAEKKQEATKKEFESALKAIETALGERVKEVRLTERLTDSPACVVFDENELTGHMQRLLAATGQEIPVSKPILELNPDHAILKRLQAGVDDINVGKWAEVLLSQALLAEGEMLKDPSNFVKSLNELLIAE
jgi:molecular chaperone HtpG